MKKIFNKKSFGFLFVYAITEMLLAKSAVNGNAGIRQYRFLVEFKDKVGTSYSILRPAEFLTPRAIQRRKKAGIAVDMQDIPVVSANLNSLTSAGAELLLSSRWLNAAMIQTTDSTLAVRISSFTTVRNVMFLGIMQKKRGAAALNPDAFDDHSLETFSVDEEQSMERILVRNKQNDVSYNNGYGDGWDQIRQLNGHTLHAAGFKGRGVLVAVLDAGFYRVNQMQVFDSLFKRRGVMATKDFAERDNSVYNDDDHGTQVLSCMAANMPGTFVGTAPDADYLLLRTEEAGGENLWEEVNWVAGAEFADSMGADIINSSLGYTTFDYPGLSHKYKDLDGETTIITKAANIAWSRGMLVVNSAGNEGDGPWQYIGAPADATGVIAVGAVDKTGKPAFFSSIGPTADGRNKPDLCAMGKSATVASTTGYIRKTNGTSFSSPVLAGMIACAVQRFSDRSPAEVRRWVTLSSSGFTDKNDKTGKGIPDFRQFVAIAEAAIQKNNAGAINSTPLSWMPADTVKGSFALKTLVKPKHVWLYSLVSEKGKIVSSGNLFLYDQIIHGTMIEPGKTGFYTLLVYDGKEKVMEKRFYFEAIEDEYDLH